MQNDKRVIMAVILAAAVIVLWQTRYVYTRMDQSQVIVRINRLTGGAEMLAPYGGWQRIDVSGPAPTPTPVPTSGSRGGYIDPFDSPTPTPRENWLKEFEEQQKKKR